jgi:hypothetical protein
MPKKKNANSRSEQVKEHLKLKKTIEEYREIKALLSIVRGNEKTSPLYGVVIAKRTKIPKRVW